jgi:hypothetical protein
MLSIQISAFRHNCSVGWPQWIQYAVTEQMKAVGCHRLSPHQKKKTPSPTQEKLKVNQPIEMDFG